MTAAASINRGRAVAVFGVFAFAYFLSTLVRGIAATLSPTLTDEFGLKASDLGLLAGGYFLGFALTQLPMGSWLDRYGPKRVIVSFLLVAVGGCLLFSMATQFPLLLAARVLTGVGVSACLMAPLTGYRRWFDPALQLRGNAWMLMVGSFGLIVATLPVHWLVPLVGWRPLFWGLAVAVLFSMAAITWVAPSWSHAHAAPVASVASATPAASGGYAEVWRSPFFWRVTPIGFFNYGGFVAMQTLWIVPWLTRVAGHSPREAAQGLFWCNVALFGSYWLWGLANPVLARRGIPAVRLLAWGLPLGLAAMALILLAGPAAGTGAWVLFCVLSTVVTLTQPAVALAFPAALAGRALSAYNLVLFAGIFVVQWGIGLAIDGFGRLGWDGVDAFRGALAAFLACCVLSYLYFLWAAPHNHSPDPSSTT